MNKISGIGSHLITQVEYFYYIGRKEEAYRTIDNIIAKSKEANDYNLLNKSNIALGSLYLHENRIYEAESILRENYANCIREVDTEGLIKTSCLLAQLLSYNGLNYEALEMIREAVDKAHQSIDFLSLIPGCYYQLTGIYWKLGELKTAIKYCDLALSQIDLYSHQDNILTWKLYNLKGIILNALGEDIYNILNYFSLARDTALNHHFVEALPEIYINIASTFLNFGNYNSAKYYLEKCIQVSEEIDNFKILSNSYEILAEIFGLQGNYRDAHSYFGKAIALRLSLESSMWSIYNKLAILERSYGHFKQAIINHEEALENINEYQEHRQKAQILSQYSITLLRMNKKDLAREFINSAKQILNSQKRNSPPELHIAEGLYFLIENGPSDALGSFFKAYSLSQEYGQPVNIVESSLYVIKCLLSIYNENYQVRYFLMAQKYIDESFEIAAKGNIYPHIIIIDLLRGGLKAAEYNYGQALKTIVKAVNKANELGFVKESEDGRNFIQQINLALSRVGSLSNIVGSTSSLLSPSVFQTGAVLTYVNKLINIKDTKVDPFDFVLITFKFTDKGPEPFFMSPSIDEFKKFKNSVEFLLNLGVMLTYLLGQGHEYFEGLYSIPIQGFKSISIALVYSSMVHDSKVSDERLNGRNFVIFCFLFPEKFEKDVSRINIKEIFIDYINKNRDVAKWEKEDLEKLKVTIINIILKSNA